jgi:hypothetical protein
VCQPEDRSLLQTDAGGLKVQRMLSAKRLSGSKERALAQTLEELEHSQVVF